MSNRALCGSNDAICETTIRFEDDKQTLASLIRFESQNVHAGQPDADPKDLAWTEMRVLF
jgi:Fe-S-cluster formation regulator IscX/YfhJ